MNVGPRGPKMEGKWAHRPHWAPGDMPEGPQAPPATSGNTSTRIRPDPGQNRPSGGRPEASGGQPEASGGLAKADRVPDFWGGGLIFGPFGRGPRALGPLGTLGTLGPLGPGP